MYPPISVMWCALTSTLDIYVLDWSWVHECAHVYVYLCFASACWTNVMCGTCTRVCVCMYHVHAYHNCNPQPLVCIMNFKLKCRPTRNCALTPSLSLLLKTPFSAPAAMATATQSHNLFRLKKGSSPMKEAQLEEEAASTVEPLRTLDVFAGLPLHTLLQSLPAKLVQVQGMSTDASGAPDAMYTAKCNLSLDGLKV